MEKEERMKIAMNEVEMRDIVERAGGMYVGLQERSGKSDLLMWNDPVTKSTLTIPVDKEISVETVKNHMVEKRSSKRKVRASVQSAVDELKADMDKLETDIINFADIMWWLEKGGKMHGVEEWEYEDVAKGLESKGVRIKY